MSDSRYAPYAQYAQPYPYATGLPQGQRPPSHYHSRDTPTHPSQAYSQSYAPNGYGVPPRSDASSLAGQSHSGYPSNSSRHRTTSMNANQPMLSQSSAVYGNPPMLQGGHPRGHSQQYGSPTDSLAHGATYMGAQPHELQADYMRSGTVTPEYYYAQAAHENPSPPRPFPCDLCALSFNRAHDLKVCPSVLAFCYLVRSWHSSVTEKHIRANGHTSAMAAVERHSRERTLSSVIRYASFSRLPASSWLSLRRLVGQVLRSDGGVNPSRARIGTRLPFNDI